MAHPPLAFRCNYQERVALSRAASDLRCSRSQFIRTAVRDHIAALAADGLTTAKVPPIPGKR